MALGESLASIMRPGLVVLLSGELGAGKTTLVRGILRGLGYKGEVRSPTFNLIHEYATTPAVCHVDLYRLDGLRGIDLNEYFSTHSVLVEWPERAPSAFEEGCPRVRITFAEGGRQVALEGLA